MCSRGEDHASRRIGNGPGWRPEAAAPVAAGDGPERCVAAAGNGRLVAGEAIEGGVGRVIEPAEGEMACGEFGPGRLPEPQEITDRVSDLLA